MNLSKLLVPKNMNSYSILFFLMFKDLLPEELRIDYKELYLIIDEHVSEKGFNINEISNYEYYKEKMGDILV